MNDYVEIFRLALNSKIDVDGARTKFLTVSKRNTDNYRFCHIRNYRFDGKEKKFLPTTEGVHVGPLQLGNFIRLARTVLRIEGRSDVRKTVAPTNLIAPLSNPFVGGVEDAWLMVCAGGNQVMMLRKRDEAIHGMNLSVKEYETIVGLLPCIEFLMCPLPIDYSDLMFYSAAYVMRRSIERLARENCLGCIRDQEDQHDCLDDPNDRYWESARKMIHFSDVSHYFRYLCTVVHRVPPAQQQPTEDILTNPSFKNYVTNIDNVDPVEKVLNFLSEECLKSY